MKKNYIQPSFVATAIQLKRNLLAGSSEPGVLPNSGKNTGDLIEPEIIGG